MNLNTMINFDGMTLFKVHDGESFTVPEGKTMTSPLGGLHSGLTAGTGNTIKPTTGGLLFMAFSDVAGPTSQEFRVKLNPGDVVACGAIGSGVTVVTVNGVTVGTVACTAVGGVLGAWA